MKRLHSCIALWVTLLTLPLGLGSVSAQPLPSAGSPLEDKPTGWYGSITPGVVLGYPVEVNSEAFNVDIPPVLGVAVPPVQVAPVEISVDTDTGFAINGAVGYQFEQARVELDLGYSQNNTNSVAINGGAVAPVDGRFDVWTLSANGFYDIPTGSAWRPYIGGGVGVASLGANNVAVDLPVLGEAVLDDSGISPIFQAQTGVAYDFSERASAYVGYRLQAVPGTNFQIENVDFEADTVFINTFQAGAQVRF